MPIEDSLALVDEDIAYFTACLVRAEAVLTDLQNNYQDDHSTAHKTAVAELAAERVEMEFARKKYLAALDGDSERSKVLARKEVKDQACMVVYAEETEKRTEVAAAEIGALVASIGKYIKLLREDQATAKDRCAEVIAAHDKLQTAIVQELETLSPSFAKGDVPIAKLWEATLTAGHLGFVYKGKTPDGAEYRYAKAKAALVEAGRITEAKGFCALRAVGARAQMLAEEQVTQ
jgi:hypothetical protein